MIWRSIQYDWYSAAIFLLFAALVGMLFFFLFNDRKRKLEAFAEPSILDSIVEKRDPLIFWLKTFLYCLAWICGVLALMQPKGNERYISTSPNGQVAITKQAAQVNLRKKTHEVIFLLDASASMNIADVSGKTRLEAAKEIVDDVIRHLKGENVSLFAFTSATIQIVPSTLDYLFTRLMLQQIEINEGETDGTDIKQALDYLRKIYFAKASPKSKTVIFLSDGGDTSLTGLTADQRKRQINEIISPIADAESKNLRVLAVGLGSSQGKEVPEVSFQGHPVVSELEEPLLRRLSSAGRGDLFVIGEQTSFQISQALSRSIAKDESFIDTSAELPPDMGERTHVYDYFYQVPLGIAILALVFCLFMPNTRERMAKRISP